MYIFVFFDFVSDFKPIPRIRSISSPVLDGCSQTIDALHCCTAGVGRGAALQLDKSSWTLGIAFHFLGAFCIFF